MIQWPVLVSETAEEAKTKRQTDISIWCKFLASILKSKAKKTKQINKSQNKIKSRMIQTTG